MTMRLTPEQQAEDDRIRDLAMQHEAELASYYDDGPTVLGIPGPGYEPMDEAAYLAWCDEMEAIHEGRAIELVPCYLCHLEATGKVAADGEGPLRGVLRHSTTPGPDPYDVQHLSCGHGLI